MLERSTQTGKGLLSAPSGGDKWVEYIVSKG